MTYQEAFQVPLTRLLLKRAAFLLKWTHLFLALVLVVFIMTDTSRRETSGADLLYKVFLAVNILVLVGGVILARRAITTLLIFAPCGMGIVYYGHYGLLDRALTLHGLALFVDMVVYLRMRHIVARADGEAER